MVGLNACAWAASGEGRPKRPRGEWEEEARLHQELVAETTQGLPGVERT